MSHVTTYGAVICGQSCTLVVLHETRWVCSISAQQDRHRVCYLAKIFQNCEIQGVCRATEHMCSDRTSSHAARPALPGDGLALRPGAKMFDVIVVGGGPAGLSAALMLGRCRRRVLVCGLGEPRQRRSQAMHVCLTRAGVR